MWSKWFPQCKQPVNIYSGFPFLQASWFLLVQEEDTIPHQRFALSFTCSPFGFYCPQTASDVLSETGQSLLEAVLSGKGREKLKVVITLPYCCKTFYHYKMETLRLTIHLHKIHCNRCVCVLFIFLLCLSVFMTHSICRCCYVRDKHEAVPYTHRTQPYISNWRKWGFYWQQCEVHIVAIELQGSVSSSLPNEYMELLLARTRCLDANTPLSSFWAIEVTLSAFSEELQ